MYYAAFLLIVFHYAILLIPIITYSITTSKSAKLAIITYMWLLLAINIYYKGCPFIHMERKLLRNRSWIGIHEWLRVFAGIKHPSTQLINYSTLVVFLVIMVAFWKNY
jgi:hypothetical protein